MLAVKCKDRKEIYTLSTLHSSPVPAERMSDNMNSEDDEDNSGDDRIITRKVRWRTVEPGENKVYPAC